MARATKADKARLLNAAYRLLGQQMERAEAARHLGREFALSRRQAYRYLKRAAELSAPVPAVEPTVAITFKLPVSAVRAIRRVRATQRTLPRPSRRSGGGDLPGHFRPATWVNDNRGVLCGRCTSTTRLIDFATTSSPRRTPCWCRYVCGRLQPRRWSVLMQMAAIYTRVSSNQQREAHTIASQTAALVEWATTLHLEVPRGWVFEDDGYSGATLERPGLERVRDLAAAGDIQVVLVHSPDRLSRKYAYQVLLIEELGRHGVETRFLNGPSSDTAEDQLLVQFQGMIAEYERAQILERSRRGKRHRARAGEISVLGGAPYGYRYLRKREDAPASYVVIDAEARVVRDVYEHYAVTGWSIAAVTRWLNEQGVPTRKTGTRWERSTVWAMLQQPGLSWYGVFRQDAARAATARNAAATAARRHHESR